MRQRSSAFGFLNPKIFVDATPDVFVFRRRNSEIAVPTKLYLDSKNDRILGVGTPPTDPHTEISIFASSSNVGGVSRDLLLAKFFKFGVMKIMNASLMLRPRFVFRLSGFENILHGFERAVFRDVAFEAGALAVEFET